MLESLHKKTPSKEYLYNLENRFDPKMIHCVAVIFGNFMFNASIMKEGKLSAYGTSLAYTNSSDLQ